MGEVTYRRSTAADDEAVFGLVIASVKPLAPLPYSQEVVDTWTSGRVAKYYRPDCAEQQIWIAELKNRPIGFAHGVPGEIVRLFVASNHVGIGVGAGLMHRALRDALPKGIRNVKIDATLNAVPFYEKWGFIIVGTGLVSGRDAALPPISIVKLEKAF